MTFRDPRALAFVLLAAGVGVLGWFGPQWYELPKWTDAEIDQSVELNLALELKQRGPLLQPTGDQLDRLRGMIRAEVVGQVRRERRDLERWLGMGLVLAVLGLTTLVKAHLTIDRSSA